MATLEHDGWTLVNAEQPADMGPPLPPLPAFAVRAALQRGDRVQVLLELLGRDDKGACVRRERVWTRVVHIAEKCYVGVLATEPATSDAIRVGDPVVFGPQHVVAILPPCGSS